MAREDRGGRQNQTTRVHATSPTQIDQSSMEALQQQLLQPPTDAARPDGIVGMAAASPQPSAHEDDFTPHELDVVETLRRLNETSTSTGGPCASNPSAASGSSSLPSVNEAPPVPAAESAQEELALPSDPVTTDGYADEDEVPGSQRRTKRYRPIAEIYRAICEVQHQEQEGSRRGKARRREERRFLVITPNH